MTRIVHLVRSPDMASTLSFDYKLPFTILQQYWSSCCTITGFILQSMYAKFDRQRICNMSDSILSLIQRCVREVCHIYFGSPCISFHTVSTLSLFSLCWGQAIFPGCFLVEILCMFVHCCERISDLPCWKWYANLECVFVVGLVTFP